MFANTGGANPGMQSQMPGGGGVAGLHPPTTQPGSTMTPSPIPGAADYLGAENVAKKAYQDALAQVNGQRKSALLQYGYTGEIDPTTGLLTNMRVDPNNPNGLYQQMLAQGNQNRLTAMDAAQARGLGHGGLAAQGLTAAHQAFGQDSAQLGQNLINTLSGYDQQQQSAYNTEQDALWTAEHQSALDAINNGNFDTPNFGGSDQIPPYDTGATDLPPTVTHALGGAKPAAPKKPASRTPVKITPTNFLTDRSSSGPIKRPTKKTTYKGRH